MATCPFVCNSGCCVAMLSAINSTTNATTINAIYSIVNALQYIVISILMLFTRRKQSIVSSIGSASRVPITLTYIIISCSLSIVFVVQTVLLFSLDIDPPGKLVLTLMYNLFYLAYPATLLYTGVSAHSATKPKSALGVTLGSVLIIAVQFTITFLVSSLGRNTPKISLCLTLPLFYLGDASPFIDLIYTLVWGASLVLLYKRRLRRASRNFICFHLVLSLLVTIAEFLVFGRVGSSLCILAVTAAIRILVSPWVFYYTACHDSRSVSLGNQYMPEEQPLVASTEHAGAASKTARKNEAPKKAPKKKLRTPKRSQKQKAEERSEKQSALKKSLARTPKKKSFFGVLSKEEKSEAERVVDFLLKNLDPSVPLVDMEDVVKEKKVGVGGFGEVYKGTSQGQTVAIKRVFDLSEAKMSVFLREINVLAQLQHPRITVLGSLFDLIHKQRAPLDWKRMHIILQDTSEGMAFLHSRDPPFLHRDLKSQNILIDENWRAKLCDFGMSRAKALAVTMTKLGTLQWVAPEVLREERYSEKADIYSFAILIWEMLARKVPFVGRSAIEVAHNVAYNGLRPNIPGSCPPQLRQLIVKCWDDEPENRGDFTQIYEDLSDMDSETW